MPVNKHLRVDEATLTRFCRQHRIRRLSLFGSLLQGAGRPESDVDLLVEFAPETRPTLFDLAAMEIELGELLGGREVDLRTPMDLSRYFREEVLREAEVQFEAA